MKQDTTTELHPWISMAKSKMREKGMTQRLLAHNIEVPESRVSEYLAGKREPTLEIARRIGKELDIAGDIMLE